MEHRFSKTLSRRPLNSTNNVIAGNVQRAIFTLCVHFSYTQRQWGADVVNKQSLNIWQKNIAYEFNEMGSLLFLLWVFFLLFVGCWVFFQAFRGAAVSAVQQGGWKNWSSQAAECQLSLCNAQLHFYSVFIDAGHIQMESIDNKKYTHTCTPNALLAWKWHVRLFSLIAKIVWKCSALTGNRKLCASVWKFEVLQFDHNISSSAKN